MFEQGCSLFPKKNIHSQKADARISRQPWKRRSRDQDFCKIFSNFLVLPIILSMYYFHHKMYISAYNSDGNGKPIAEILPLTKREASWKREVPRLTVPGLSLSREILKDRAEPGA
jgi:hypothetical protein